MLAALAIQLCALPIIPLSYYLNMNSARISNLWKTICSWWRHQMETFSALLAICAGNSPVSGEFPAQRPVTRSFDIFFDLRLDKRLSEQSFHDGVIKWKHFPRYWPFVRGIHQSPVNSPHKGQWRGALIFSLICVWINGWVNNREAGDLRRFRAHYDVSVMSFRCLSA